jgi:hypothetical protein
VYIGQRESLGSFSGKEDFLLLLHSSELPDISNNVGSVKNVLSVLLRSLLRAFSFVVFFGPTSMTTARL